MSHLVSPGVIYDRVPETRQPNDAQNRGAAVFSLRSNHLAFASPQVASIEWSRTSSAVFGLVTASRTIIRQRPLLANAAA